MVRDVTAVSYSDFARNDERDDEARLRCRHLQGPTRDAGAKVGRRRVDHDSRRGAR